MNLKELILDVLTGFDIDLANPELEQISSYLVDTVMDWIDSEGYSKLEEPES